LNIHDKLNLNARGLILDSENGDIIGLPFGSFDKARTDSDIKNID
jgi:hypothetical protein